jgi:hypothetical protein
MGVISLFSANFSGPNPASVFRFVQISDAHIPPPNVTVPGDFNENGSIDLDDVNLLRRAADENLPSSAATR